MTTTPTWHNHTFSLKISMEDTPIDLKESPAKNQFIFEGEPDHTGRFYLYFLKPMVNGHGCDMKNAWKRCGKFLPQPGAVLTWALEDDEKLDPDHDDDQTHLEKLQKIIDDITDNKINDTSITYERLVGMVDAEDADNPLTFYRVSKVYLNNDDRLLLIAVANLINGGAPVGTLAAES